MNTISNNSRSGIRQNAQSGQTGKVNGTTRL